MAATRLPGIWDRPVSDHVRDALITLFPVLLMLCTACLWSIAAVGLWIAAPWDNLFSEKVVMEILFLVGLLLKHLLDERNRRIDSKERQVIAAKVNVANVQLAESDAKLNAKLDANTEMTAKTLVHAAEATGRSLPEVLHEFDHRVSTLLDRYHESAAEKVNAQAEEAAARPDAPVRNRRGSRADSAEGPD